MASLFSITKESFLSVDSIENVAWKLVFNFQRILYEKESEDVCMLIWIDFNSFAITYLI